MKPLIHAEVDAINNALRKISPNDDLKKVKKYKIRNNQTLTKSEM